MKKFIALFLCLTLLIPVTGCSSGSTDQTGKFYYRRAAIQFGVPDGVITWEERRIPDPESDINELLLAYFSGPEDDAMLAPFPRDSAVVAWEIAGDTITLTMNPAFGSMSGVELSIACACICKTFTELLPVTQIRIQLKEGTLDGEKYLMLTPNEFWMYDNVLDLSREEFTVYYTDSQRRYLIEEIVTLNLATDDDVVTQLIQALMTPPENSGLHSALPRYTDLLDYSIDDGICTINFSSDFERYGYTKCESQRLSLLCVVNTLTQLDVIDQVEFASEGNLLVAYKSLTISEPFVFDEDVIGPVRTGMNEFDVTLYLPNGNDGALAAVPTRIRQSSGISQPELVVQALLDYENANSLYSQIPEGTAIRLVRVRNGTCLIDLSGEFLSNEAHLLRSVRSIVASVCSLDNINSAQITVDGKTPEGDIAHLFQVLYPQSSWFL